MAKKKKTYEKPNVKKVQVDRTTKLRESVASSCGACVGCGSCACGSCGCAGCS
ncbi:MAG: hypothetical protein KJ710_01645 [Candidatus Omnitrophica bacterium]|nr:hypothetical protein [Candidatus Omnitrophota bacterium]MBU1922954.1 hypothetical protein [Candidatus Omnitrophota bacterium]